MTFDLRTERINAGMSQRELSEKLGVPLVTVQNLENGLTARPSNAKPIADFFGVKVTDLMPLERSTS